MKTRSAFGVLAACTLSPSIFAQGVAGIAQDPVPAPLPVQAIAPAEDGSQASLPANTEIALTMNEDLTTKGGRIEVGHMFKLTVSQDVRLGDYVVIPRGTPATGEVTWLTGKGAFGKSGKMEIDLRHVDLNGRRIPVTGHYRQEGEGNTVATVAGVVAVGVFAAFITGKSARIPQGRELKAFTAEPLPVTLPRVAAMPTRTGARLPEASTNPASVAPGISVAGPGSKLR